MGVTQSVHFVKGGLPVPPCSLPGTITILSHLSSSLKMIRISPLLFLCIKKRGFWRNPAKVSVAITDACVLQAVSKARY